MKSKIEILRSIYLFSISLIGVVMVIFGLISFTSSLVDVIYKSDSLYRVSSLANAAFAVVVGLFLFIFHWAIIKREGRLGALKGKVYQSDENFWGNFFFYAVAFIGLLVMSFSFMRLGSQIFHVGYPEMPRSKPVAPGGEKPPMPEFKIYPNVEGIIKSVISLGIGFFAWIWPWRVVERIRNGSLQGETKGTDKQG
jgi:hypothetical protein